MERKSKLERRIDEWEGCCQCANKKAKRLEGLSDIKEIRVLFHEYQEEVKKAHGIFREIVEGR